MFLSTTSLGYMSMSQQSENRCFNHILDLSSNLKWQAGLLQVILFVILYSVEWCKSLQVFHFNTLVNFNTRWCTIIKMLHEFGFMRPLKRKR